MRQIHSNRSPAGRPSPRRPVAHALRELVGLTAAVLALTSTVAIGQTTPAVPTRPASGPTPPGSQPPAAGPNQAPGQPASRPAAPARPGAPGTAGAPGTPGAAPAKRPGGTPVAERVEGLRPRPVPPKVNFAGGPAIWFDVLDADFGPMTNAETKHTTFTFYNVGDAPLTVADIVAACGCTRPTFDKGKTYQPGESGTVQVAFTPPTGGHQAKSMSVMTNAKNPGEVVKIRVIGEVEGVLSFEPRTVDVGEIKAGAGWEGEVYLKSDAAEVTFDTITATPRAKGLTIGWADPGPHQGTAKVKIKISPDVQWGLYRTGVAEVVTKGKLENGQEVSKKLPLRVVAKVVDDVKATDFVVQCGNRNFNDAFTGEVIIYGDKEFEIVDPKIEGLPKGSKGVADVEYKVRVEPSTDPEKKGWKIIIDGQAAQSQGFISGTVTFGTRLKGGDAITARQLGVNGYVVEPGGRPPMAPGRG